jgi:Domain of unknown function (DUF4386)
MTATVHTPPATRPPMDPMRRRSLAAGILYLITFVSIPSLALYKPVKDQVGDFVLGAGSDTGVMWAALSEVIVGLAGIGTAIVLFPVLKRQSETPALGFVAARIVEATLIFAGVVSILSIVTLRNDVAGSTGADPASLVTIGQAHLATYNWTMLLSQSLAPVFCDLFLGYLLYRSGLVPRILPIIALVGAPLLLASDVAVFFGANDQFGPVALLAAIPVAVFEFSLGVYLIVKGFRPSPILAAPIPSIDRDAELSPA